MAGDVVHFVARVEVGATAERTWQALVDWPAHARWVPFTTVQVLTPSAAGVGARFVGRSGVGRLAFDDPMEVVEWAPPQPGRAGRCAVVKQGAVVLGTASFEVAELGGGRSIVRWTEDVQIVPVALTRWFSGVIAVLGRLAFERTLRAMARELEAGPGRG